MGTVWATWWRYTAAVIKSQSFKQKPETAIKPEKLFFIILGNCNKDNARKDLQYFCDAIYVYHLETHRL